VRPDYTFRWDGKLYQISREAVTTGLRGANVRVEKRLDGSLAVRHGERYLAVAECAVADKPKSKPVVKPAQAQKGKRRRRGSDWDKHFELKKAPPLWQAASDSGYRRGDQL
jgi:hypothetical protein